MEQKKKKRPGGGDEPPEELILTNLSGQVPSVADVAAKAEGAMKQIEAAAKPIEHEQAKEQARKPPERKRENSCCVELKNCCM